MLRAGGRLLQMSPQASAPRKLRCVAGPRKFCRNQRLGPGYIAVEGFADLTLDATREIVGHGTTQLTTSGNARLIAANIGTASDADLTIAAAGGLSTARSATALTDVSRRTRELGGSMLFSADSIVHEGAIQIGSGRVPEMSSITM